MAHPPEVGGVGLERGGDGALEGDGAVGVEQLDESTGEDTEVVVTIGGGDEQGLGRWGGVVETVGGAVLSGGALVALEFFDVCGVFDLLGAVERAPMGGEHGGGVEDAHGLEREVGERGAEVEAHEGVSGVAQHQDERHQGAFGASDGELSEVRPVDLSLLARKGAKAQIRFTGPARAQVRDAMTEVVGTAGVAARLDHVEQPSGAQRGEAFQRLGDERP